MKDLPTEGILQFWVEPSEYLGLNADEDLSDQANFRIIYHSEVKSDNIIEKLNFITEYLPIHGYTRMCTEEKINICKYGYQLNFSKKTMHVTCDDMALECMVDEGKISTDEYDEIFNALFDFDYGNGHRIGGYSKNRQGDPRIGWDKEKYNYDFLLLQIDGKSGDDIEIGDCGVMNFFINSEKLKNKDFSDIVYWWDCH
jgi:uncharacterized protein YwqG